MISLTTDNRMLAYGSLGSYANISHFVTTRYGGCSEGAYGSFNCSPYCGDEAKCVAHNQELLLQAFSQRPRELILPFQTHGTSSRVIDEAFLAASAEQRKELLNGIDAVMTCQPGCCVCVSTADCVPILLYDTAHQAVAAVHAGWRGTVNFILGHTLERMRAVFGTHGREVVACIGPSISMESFEVGEEVYDAFRTHGFDLTRMACWNAETKKHHIDLWEANRQQLLDAGVASQQIETAGICTYIHHEQFFSARRLGIASGRMVSGIMIQ